MKFFIAEKNIGYNVTKEQVEIIIKKLQDKGWDVEYGLKENILNENIDTNQINEIQDDFANDFITVIEEAGL